MAEQDEKKRLEVLKKEFDNDTAIVAEQASHFVTTMQPAYMVSEAIVSDSCAQQACCIWRCFV